LHRDPARLLSVLNERLTHLLPRGQFATFLYAIVDHAAGTLLVASAGSPPPIITAGIEGPSCLFETAGVPLGIAPGLQYEQHIHAFAPGSRLLLFSDGLPEFPNISGDRIGEAGLVAAIDAVKPDLAPGDVIDGLCRLTGIADAAMLPDDTTIICIDRRGDLLPDTCKQCVLSGDIPLLDEDQIGLLREALDPDELAGMLSELPLAARLACEAIEAAVGSEQLEEAQRAAHVLKGTASSFGAARLAEIARKIELELPSIEVVDGIMPLLIETIAKTTAALPLEARKTA
jgi:HPt (histidine-containing phosphotransfer) domain-containing protein